MRTYRWAPIALLVVGALSLVGSLVSDLVELVRGTASSHVSLPWLLVVATPTFLIGVWAHRHRPDHAASRQLLAFGALLAISELVGTVQNLVAADPSAPPGAAMALAHHLVVTVTTAVIVRLVALYPEGVPERSWERRGLAATWSIVALPFVVAVSNPTVVVPSFAADPSGGPNPWLVDALSPVGPVAVVLLFGSQALLLPAVGVLVARYRRGDAHRRSRIRWLLLPALAVATILLLDLLLLSLGPVVEARSVVSALWLPVLPLWTAAMAAGLRRQPKVAIDLGLRRSLVYGVLWAMIAVGYVGLTAALGLVAVNRFPVEVAIVGTIVATLGFQPLRRRLERLADRWVFGQRLGRYESLRRLGQALEEGHELGDLLPHLARTIRAGIDLAAVRVVVGGADHAGDSGADVEAWAGRDEGVSGEVVTVPILHDGVELGRIECHAVAGEPLDDAERELLEELARQSGLALRNLRLTSALEQTVASLRQRTTELQRSRTELVQAQEEERRRLERDLHDGVQQHVVAAIAQLGLARRHAERDPASVSPALAELQDELGLVLDELRELARGVHPSLLSAGGLVAAVEAQTGRSSVPVTVSADPDLRTERYAPELEGAAYFTVTEALTNVLKHADASRAEVTLAREDGHLRVVIRDDGCGFALGRARGGVGLRNLAGRVEALGGTLEVDSRPGGGTTVTAELVVGGGERADG